MLSGGFQTRSVAPPPREENLIVNYEYIVFKRTIRLESVSTI
jgi:hypothetical protein